MIQVYKIPLDKDICDKIGDYFYSLMNSYGVHGIIDPIHFLQLRNYEPDIGSIFLFGQGGSYDFTDSRGRTVFITNGTLHCGEALVSSRPYLKEWKKHPVYSLLDLYCQLPLTSEGKVDLDEINNDQIRKEQVSKAIETLDQLLIKYADQSDWVKYLTDLKTLFSFSH